MAEKNNRMIPFLKILMNHNDYMKSEDICNSLQISGRTLRDDIGKFNEVFIENGLFVLSKHGTGYRFQINDEVKFHKFIANLLKEEEEAQRLLPVYPEDRINYLIKRLLNQEDYIKLEDIADQLYISRSTIQNDMKEVRERLRYFHLELVSKPAYGTRLEGSEMHKRSCISQYFFHTESMDDLFTKRNAMTPQQEMIRDILFDTLNKTNFRLSDIGFQNLIIHISIAIQREKEAFDEDIQHYQDVFDTVEYEVATQLVEALNQSFHIHLKPIETCYITIHLMGKKTMQHHSEYAITQEIEDMLKAIFLALLHHFDYDFTKDFELYTVLALHFQPMLNRLRYGLSMQNPILEEIKKENNQAFEMAVISADVIYKKTGSYMSEGEMGYLALHYALAIERAVTRKQKKKNIIVVCASGAGSSQILMYKIRQRFGAQIDKTQVIELYKLQTLEQSEYDFILTTVPISFPTKIPVIEVQYFLGGSDVEQVCDAFKDSTQGALLETYFQAPYFFSDIEGKTKEDVLKAMVDKVNQRHMLPKMFLESVFQREQLSPTEFGNMIAMPHPMSAMCDTTFVAVAILKNPIRWTRQSVRFIFLMCVEKDMKDSLQVFHETMSSLVDNKQMLSKLEKHPTFSNLMHIITELAQVEAINDGDIFR